MGVMIRVFANRSGDRDSMPGRVIPNTQNIILDASLLNTQHYKVRIKCNQGKEKRFPVHLDVVPIEKKAFWSPSTTVDQLIYRYIHTYTYADLS